MFPLVVRSNQILDVLGSEFGEPLIERCGFLLIARNDATTSCHGKPGFLATTMAAAQRVWDPTRMSDEARKLPIVFPNLPAFMATRKLITSRVAVMYVPSRPSPLCYPAPKRAAQP